VALVPLAARLVEVIADRGDAAAARYVYGSGCIVSGRTVLTAAHVVAGAQRVQVRNPDKKMYSATMDPGFVGDPNGPGPDLALVEIDNPDVDLPPLGLARVDRDSPADEPVERCHAIGYPWFAETPSPTTVRDTVDAIGMLPALSKLAAGLLSVQVAISPRPLPAEDKSLAESEWSGMSGGPVLAAGRLLGVVTEHAPREGPSAITAVPLTALEQDPAHPRWGPGVANPSDWWARLGVTGIADLQPLPAPPPERPPPAYWATVREFGRALHRRMPQLLGRQQDLAEIAAFATGPGGYRWLVGGAYAGKTALLYEAVTAGLPDEVDVVCYFLSRRASDADSSRFLAAVVPQLAYLCELDPPVADRDQFYALWERATERAAETGRPLLLVIDGLDEDNSRPAGLPSVAGLLPAVEGRAHVLVSSRPYPELPGDVEDHAPLKSTATRVDLTPFEGAKKLAGLARQEIDNLTHDRDSGLADLAAEVLGLLAAAAGPLSVRDLATLSNDLAPPAAAQSRRVRRLVAEQAARSLEPVGLAAQPRYQFAHYSLLEYAQDNEDLADPEYRNRIHQWAERWRDRGWPTSLDATEGTPQYLLDSYPGTLASDPSRLVALVSDVGWVDAAIQSTGVDQVLADLGSAAAADPANPALAAMLATVSGQAQHLRPPSPVTSPGYVLRQLCLQADEFDEDRLGDEIRAQLQAHPDPSLVPLWTTRRASRGLLKEVGDHDDRVLAVAVLPNGRVVSGGEEGRVLVWNLAAPGTDPVELGRHEGVHEGVMVWELVASGTGLVEVGRRSRAVEAVAVLPNGWVVTGGADGRVLVWDLAAPGADPVELGRHDDPVLAVAVLPDGLVGVDAGRPPAAGRPGGRVVSGGEDGRVLVWDLAAPGADPVELGRHDDRVLAVAVLADGRVVGGGADGWVLVWDLAAPGTDPVELGRHDRAVQASAALGPSPAKVGRHDRAVEAVAVLPNGRVVTGGADGRVLVWDLAASGTDPVEVGRHDDRVQAVAVLPDGRVVSGGADRRVRLWDSGTAPTARSATVGHLNRTVSAVAVLPDGRVVSSGTDRRIWVWDRDGPVEIGAHKKGAVQGLAVLSDGRVVSSGVDGRILMWDPAATERGPVEAVHYSDPIPPGLAVLPDGRLLCGWRGGWTMMLFDPRTPSSDPVWLKETRGEIWSVAVLPGGRVVSGGGDGRVLVWDLAAPRKKPVEVGRHQGGAWAVAVLPDGRIVSGGADGHVQVWDLSTPGAGPIEVGRHLGQVRAIAALPDGRVASGGGDRRVRLWDVLARTEIAQIRCPVSALARGPSGPGAASVVVSHGQGLSLWSIA
jgi:WD40 repeat protein